MILNDLSDDAMRTIEALARGALARGQRFAPVDVVRGDAGSIAGESAASAGSALPGMVDPEDVLALLAELRRRRSLDLTSRVRNARVTRTTVAAMSEEELRVVTVWLESALRLIRDLAPSERGRSVDHLIDHALLQAGLE